MSDSEGQYGLKERGFKDFKVKQRYSQVWKGLVWGAQLLHEGLRWRVRDGLKTKFWVDKWLGDESLKQNCRQTMPEEDLQNRVHAYWEQGRGWKWEVLTHS